MAGSCGQVELPAACFGVLLHSSAPSRFASPFLAAVAGQEPRNTLTKVEVQKSS